MNDLHHAGASFAIVGGLAVGIRTEPRFTRDADMAVSVAGDQEAEALVFGLVSKATRPSLRWRRKSPDASPPCVCFLP